MKDVIDSGGALIASRRVEDVLYEHPAVAGVAVVGLPDERWIEAVTAIVVPRAGAAVTAGELTAYARDHLARTHGKGRNESRGLHPRVRPLDCFSE